MTEPVEPTFPIDRVAVIMMPKNRSKMSKRKLLILMALLLRGNKYTGISWPSTETIARDTGLDVKDTQRELKALREMGLIAEISAPSGRKSRQSQVCPTASHTSKSDWLEGGKTPPRTEGGETPPQENLEGGVLAVEGGETPPYQGAKHPPESLKKSFNPRDDFAEKLQKRELTLTWLLKDHSIGTQNRFRARSLLDAFDDAGGTRRELGDLAAEANGQPGVNSPPSVFWSWLKDPTIWKGVLADRRQRKRRMRSKLSRGASETDPKSIADIGKGVRLG